MSRCTSKIQENNGVEPGNFRTCKLVPGFPPIPGNGIVGGNVGGSRRGVDGSTNYTTPLLREPPIPHMWPAVECKVSNC